MDELLYRTREIMRKFSIYPNKRLGQNFLVNKRILDLIVEAGEITKEDLIIEIGSGLGILTQQLCERADKVIGVELDRKLVEVLKNTLSKYTNIRIVHADILKLDLRTLLKEENNKNKIKVVANLPYYITTPIIMKLFEDDLGLESLVVMLQKEVAERIIAKPGGKDYGALTIAVKYYGNPVIVANVPPHSFIPQPEVESSVVKINIHKIPIVEVEDKKLFFKIIKVVFSQRRKTILNGLVNSGLFKQDKEQIKKLLNSIGINETSRPETLSIYDFAKIVNEMRYYIIDN